MSACNVCKGRIKRELTTYSQWYQGHFIVIENVPAWVCAQCGETYYDPDIVERIQALIWSEQAPSRLIETAVYDLNAI